MQEDDFALLARIRLERAEELLHEAEELLCTESYKSANNRAYYSIEKCINALLAVAKVQTLTHKGCLKQFNLLYIVSGDGFFKSDDYKIAAKAEQIRSVSDYDDFYIASKRISEEQVESAKYFYNKVKEFLADTLDTN